jgi:guanine deaminase
VTEFAQRTIDLARRNVAEGGRPFATVIIGDGEVLAESANRVAQTNDPTAHAEIPAIRDACTKLDTEHYLDDRKYFEVSTFYDEFAKTWDRRRPPMRCEPHEAAVDAYRFWNERRGGRRKSTVVPPGRADDIAAPPTASLISAYACR